MHRLDIKITSVLLQCCSVVPETLRKYSLSESIKINTLLRPKLQKERILAFIVCFEPYQNS